MFPPIVENDMNVFNRKSGILDNGNDSCPLFKRPNSLANTCLSFPFWPLLCLESIYGENVAK